jgi:hypothetical protein
MYTFKFMPGFNIIQSNKPGPIFVAPHGTLTYRQAEREDVGTENVAFLAVQEMGGSAIISNIPRLGMFGIDYNRSPPDKNTLINDMDYIRGKDKLVSYYKNYAWVAQNMSQHKYKKKVYDSFWNITEKLGKKQKRPFYIFCHALNSRIKNMPTAVDLITGRGSWIDRKKITRIARKINKSFDFTHDKKDLETDMRFHAMLEKNIIKQCFGSGGMKVCGGIRREWMEGDIKNANRILKKKYTMNEMSFEQYFKIVDEVVEKTDFKVTVENTYYGDTAKPVAPLLKKTKGIGLEVESQGFLNEVHTNEVVSVIQQVVKDY